VAAGRLLIGVDGDEHGDPSEKMSRPLDDVEMTRGDRVEGAGIDRMLPQPIPVGRIQHRPRLSIVGKIKIKFHRLSNGPWLRRPPYRLPYLRGAGRQRRINVRRDR
jgi:hypothetical protein